MSELTVERLREVLIYDPETGEFRWRDVHGGLGAKGFGGRRRKAGVVGSYCTGYLLIKLDGRLRGTHRLAWFYVHGHWPVADIDHINGIRDDNRIVNLREATRSQNGANSKSYAKSGFKGVFNVNGRYRASMSFGGRTFHLGTFTTPEEAHEVYMSAARAKHGEFARA